MSVLTAARPDLDNATQTSLLVLERLTVDMQETAKSIREEVSNIMRRRDQEDERDRQGS